MRALRLGPRWHWLVPCCLLAGQPAAVSAGARLALTAGIDELAPGHQLAFLLDPQGSLTAQDVASPAWAGRFEPSSAAFPDFGYVDAVVWARLQVVNRDHPSSTWFLDLGSPFINDARLFAPATDGSGLVEQRSGNLAPLDHAGNRPNPTTNSLLSCADTPQRVQRRRPPHH
jgi:hypothetical protein